MISFRNKDNREVNVEAGSVNAIYEAKDSWVIVVATYNSFAVDEKTAKGVLQQVEQVEWLKNTKQLN